MRGNRNNIVEGEPGMFPDPIARLFVWISRRVGHRGDRRPGAQAPPSAQAPPGGQAAPAQQPDPATATEDDAGWASGHPPDRADGLPDGEKP